MELLAKRFSEDKTFLVGVCQIPFLQWFLQDRYVLRIFWAMQCFFAFDDTTIGKEDMR
jgi:hypothetical protein